MSYFFQGFPTIKYDVYSNGKPIDAVNLFRTVRLKNGLQDNVLLYKTYTIQEGERPDHVATKLYGSADYYWTFLMVNENLVNIYKDWPLTRSEMLDKFKMKYPGYALLSDEDFSTKFEVNETVRGVQSGATAVLTQKDSNLGIIRIDSIVGTFKANELIEGLTSKDTLTISNQVDFKDAPHHFEKADGTSGMRGELGSYPITFAEWEYAINDEKSTIRVIRPEYIAKVAQEFFNLINPDQ